MEIAAVMLADAVTVRDGLLNVLGGGITRMWREQLPAPMAVDLAIVVNVPPEGLGLPHELELRVQDEAQEIAKAMMGFQAMPHPRMEPGEHQLVPVKFPVQGIGVGRYGRHRLTVSLDHGVDEGVLEFWVLHPDEQVLPPLG